MEVVNKQRKEIDGEREAVDARERALHREATVTLDKGAKLCEIVGAQRCSFSFGRKKKASLGFLSFTE